MLLVLPITLPASSNTIPFLLLFIWKLYSPCLDSFYWNFFPASSFLIYQLPLTHLITCLEIWCFLGSCDYHLLLFCYDFSNRFSSTPFCVLFPPSQVSGETIVSPTLICSPSLWHHSYTFSNHFSADSSEILLSVPAFPFRLKCRHLPPIPYRCLADSSAQLKLSS